jgi:hypothetical protein
MGRGRTSIEVVKRQPKPGAAPAARYSLAAMTRRHCTRCGDFEALFSGSVCCSCGANYAAKAPRRRRAHGPATIADNDGNLLALMRAKA